MPANPVDTLPKSALTIWLCKLTGFCARNAWFTIVLATVSSVGCIYYSFQNLTFKTDRADLIDPSAQFYQRWLRYTKLFGDTDDIVIVVESRDQESLKQALEEIGSRLSDYPDLFSNVFYKVDPGSLHAKGLQYLSPELLASGLEKLDEYRPILNGRWELITLNGVMTRIQRQLSRLRGQSDEELALLHHADLLTTSLLKTLQNRNEFTNPWPEILSAPSEMQEQDIPTDYLLNESGTMGFVMATAAANRGTFEGPTAAIELVRLKLQQARRKYSSAKFYLTGISVLENDEMRLSLADSTKASIMSFIGVAVLLLLGFRGFLHPVLGLAMLAVGMAWSFGYTTYAIGHLNILSVSFAAMLMGLGIDFAIHVLSRYLELRHEGRDLMSAIVLTSESVGVGIITGAVTTSLAFFCATLTDFLGVAELGIIAGGGILLCAVAAFTILPAMISIADRNTEVKELPKPFQAVWLRSLTLHHPFFVLSASLVCMGTIGLQAFDWSRPAPKLRVVYDHNLLHLQAKGLESVEAQDHIFKSSKHSLLYALSIANSAEEARTLKRKFERLGSVSQVQELATKLPETRPIETQLLVQAYHAQLANLPTEPPTPSPIMPATVGQSLERFLQFVKNRPDADSKRISSSIDTFLDEFDRISLQDQMTFLGEFEYRLCYALLAQFQAIADASHPEPVTADDLPAELKLRFVSPGGKWLLQIFPKDQIWDMEPLERFVNDVRGIDPDATGTPLQNYEAARQIKQSYEICALYAMGVILMTLLVDFAKKKNLYWTFVPPLAATAIVVVLMQYKILPWNPAVLLGTFTSAAFLLALFLDQRSVGDSFLALLPPVAGMGMTYGLLVIFNIPLNPANLIILPLILGIGVDNGVHILHDFHAKPDSVYSTSPSTINAIMLTSTTTMVGFGSMMVSAHRGLYSLGAVLTIGIGACLFVSLVTLPALLTLFSRHRRLNVSDSQDGESSPGSRATGASVGPFSPLDLPPGVVQEPAQIA